MLMLCVLQGRSAADVCKELGVQHVVYSGAEVCAKVAGIAVEHFDGKGQVEEYMMEIGSLSHNTLE